MDRAGMGWDTARAAAVSEILCRLLNVIIDQNTRLLGMLKRLRYGDDLPPTGYPWTCTYPYPWVYRNKSEGGGTAGTSAASGVEGRSNGKDLVGTNELDTRQMGNNESASAALEESTGEGTTASASGSSGDSSGGPAMPGSERLQMVEKKIVDFGDKAPMVLDFTKAGNAVLDDAITVTADMGSTFRESIYRLYCCPEIDASKMSDVVECTCPETNVKPGSLELLCRNVKCAIQWYLSTHQNVVDKVISVIPGQTLVLDTIGCMNAAKRVIGAGEPSGGCGSPEWVKGAAKLRDMADLARREHISFLVRLEMGSKFPGTEQAMKMKSQKRSHKGWAGEGEEKCLLTAEGVRHNIASWLDWADKKQLQQVSLSVCEDVRRASPVSMLASKFSVLPRREVEELIAQHRKPCTDLCQVDEDQLEHGCRSCRYGALLVAENRHETPRWVWYRQSTVYRKRRKSLKWRRGRRRNDWFCVGMAEPECSRVPPLFVKHMTWAQGIRSLQGGLALPPQLQSLTFGDSFNHSLRDIEWPATLRVLTLGGTFNCSVDGLQWPPALRELTFGARFNQSVEGVSFPSTLERITFGQCFNQPIAGVVWPSKLRSLTFDGRFNQPIGDVSFPPELRDFVVGASFNQPIDGVAWPQSLRRFELRGWAFGRSISKVKWPDGLVHMDLGGFNDSVESVVWPSALEELWMGDIFNHPIENVVWPSGLKCLYFGHNFSQAVDAVTWPPALKVLHLGPGCYHSDGSPVTGPAGLISFRGPMDWFS